MNSVKKVSFSRNEKVKINLTRERLIAEIRRIKRSKESLAGKINKIRSLVEVYFKTDSNEEFLNANLP